MLTTLLWVLVAHLAIGLLIVSFKKREVEEAASYIRRNQPGSANLLESSGLDLEAVVRWTRIVIWPRFLILDIKTATVGLRIRWQEKRLAKANQRLREQLTRLTTDGVKDVFKLLDPEEQAIVEEYHKDIVIRLKAKIKETETVQSDEQ